MERGTYFKQGQVGAVPGGKENGCMGTVATLLGPTASYIVLRAVWWTAMDSWINSKSTK